MSAFPGVGAVRPPFVSATPPTCLGGRVAGVLRARTLRIATLLAAAGAAFAWLEKARLTAELRSSIASLASSRSRMVEAAEAERRRIEQDLHDGAQQQLVSMRIRLGMAAAELSSDPQHGASMLREIGEQMDEALAEVRRLATGVYPPSLAEHGLNEAIRSMARHCPSPPFLDLSGVRRYDADTEAAVYFCCLEAMQNIAKHAGPYVDSTVRIWEKGQELRFEVRDEGAGFADDSVRHGHGLLNMRDRVEASDGTLSVTSREGHGTVVRGRVPLRRRRRTRARRIHGTLVHG